MRTCTLDSGSLTMDTELARIEHSCGVFDFIANPDDENAKPERLKGCIEVCDWVDGCNGSQRIQSQSYWMIVFVILYLKLYD